MISTILDTALPLLTAWMFRLSSVAFSAMVLVALTGVRELHADDTEGLEQLNAVGKDSLFARVRLLTWALSAVWLLGWFAGGLTELYVSANVVGPNWLVVIVFIVDLVLTILQFACVSYAAHHVFRWSKVLQARHLERYQRHKAEIQAERDAVVVQLREMPKARN